VNVYLKGALLSPTVNHLLVQALFMQISGIAFHSPSRTGFVYLEFSWTHGPFFYSVQPYPHVAITVFFYYLQFAWGGAWKFLPQQHSINTSVSFMSPLKFFFLTILKIMYFLLYKLRLFSF
jgi:hypothetical protein